MPGSRSLSGLALLLVTTAGLAQEPAATSGATLPSRPVRPAHTYSIVALDTLTGELGVAVQSHWFSVGSSVTWAEPGTGAVATQSFIDPSYGALGLELMRAGRSAREALDGLTAADPSPEVRQVGMVDARGGVAAFTGALAIRHACDVEGPAFTVQANLMHHETVCDAMVRAFTTSEGDLAERMLRALEAAEGEGGDIRGRQSAALLVVAAEPSGRPWADRIFDLRIEDHPDPVVELRRLLGVARAYRYMSEGDERVTEGDIDAAVEAYRRASDLLPGESEPIFWLAVTLASVGRVDESLPLFARSYAMRPEWRELVPRLVDAGLLPPDPTLLDRVLGAGVP